MIEKLTGWSPPVDDGSARPERFVPAAGRFLPTARYDRSIALTMREDRWRPLLVRQAIAAVGDGDEQALRLARSKPGAARVGWRLGLAGALDLPDDEADAVVISLVLHHLGPAGKRRALREIRRVLRPGGQLHVADWGRPATTLLRAGYLALQLADGFDGTRDHAAGRLPRFLREAGFDDVCRYRQLRTVYGSLELLRAQASS